MIDYIAKEKELLEKLEETNYEYYNGYKKGTCDMIIRRFSSIPNYINSIIKMEIEIPVILKQYSGQEVRDRIEHLDFDRHIEHEYTKECIKALNNAYLDLGFEPLIDPEYIENNPDSVANFCFEYVSNVYQINIKNQMERPTLRYHGSSRDFPYLEKDTISKQINEILKNIEKQKESGKNTQQSNRGEQAENKLNNDIIKTNTPKNNENEKN